MARLLFALLLSLSSYAQQGKIDMHGGKESYEYNQRGSFTDAHFGMATFLDKNATKKEEPTQK